MTVAVGARAGRERARGGRGDAKRGGARRKRGRRAVGSAGMTVAASTTFQGARSGRERRGEARRRAHIAGGNARDSAFGGSGRASTGAIRPRASVCAVARRYPSEVSRWSECPGTTRLAVSPPATFHAKRRARARPPLEPAVTHDRAEPDIEMTLALSIANTLAGRRVKVRPRSSLSPAVPPIPRPVLPPPPAAHIPSSLRRAAPRAHPSPASPFPPPSLCPGHRPRLGPPPRCPRRPRSRRR